VKRWYVRRRLRWAYRRADVVVANSEGVARDVATLTGLPQTQTPVVRNPVVTAGLRALAREWVAHPWLAEGQPGVVLGGGSADCGGRRTFRP
jgi:hypothetical protein